MLNINFLEENNNSKIKNEKPKNDKVPSTNVGSSEINKNSGINGDHETEIDGDKGGEDVKKSNEESSILFY